MNRNGRGIALGRTESEEKGGLFFLRECWEQFITLMWESRRVKGGFSMVPGLCFYLFIYFETGPSKPAGL